MEAENESGSDQENYSRLVSSVIHEYDIIDVEPGARSEDSANEDVKSRDSSQDDVTLPRVNCPEKIVRMMQLHGSDRVHTSYTVYTTFKSSCVERNIGLLTTDIHHALYRMNKTDLCIHVHVIMTILLLGLLLSN